MIKSVRIEGEHKIMLEWLKDSMGLRDQHGEDSQTIKRAITISFNVLHMLGFNKIDDILKLKSRDYLQYQRGIQYEKIKKSNTSKRNK